MPPAYTLTNVMDGVAPRQGIAARYDGTMADGTVANRTVASTADEIEQGCLVGTRGDADIFGTGKRPGNAG